jgi:hypothetical protein
MDWIIEIEKRLRKKKTSLIFEVFKILVYLSIGLFVLSLLFK